MLVKHISDRRNTFKEPIVLGDTMISETTLHKKSGGGARMGERQEGREEGMNKALNPHSEKNTISGNLWAVASSLHHSIPG